MKELFSTVYKTKIQFIDSIDASYLLNVASLSDFFLSAVRPSPFSAKVCQGEVAQKAYKGGAFDTTPFERLVCYGHRLWKHL